MYSLGIYIHVPFCRSKCGYCDFCSVADFDGALKDAYVKAVLRHIAESKSIASKYTVDTIYFGGGTPTVLGQRHLIKILRAVEKAFAVSKNAEITVEANPESADSRQLKRLRKAGFNRVSLGVQSSDDRELQALGRLHSFSGAKEAVKNARAAGFRNLSLDLMYGLPGQSVDAFLLSVREILSLSPEHISCYALKLEPGTPLYKASPPLPPGDEQADMYEAATRLMENAGYGHYEISNYAKHGFRSRHNQKYWDLSEYLGFGPASHSFCGGRRFSYTKDIKAYIDGFLKGGEVLDEYEEEDPINRLGEYVMLRLRTADGIEENDFTRRFKMDFQPFAEKFKRYIEAGFASCDGRAYRLTTKGFFVSNTIILDVLSAAEEMDLSRKSKSVKWGEKNSCAQ